MNIVAKGTALAAAALATGSLGLASPAVSAGVQVAATPPAPTRWSVPRSSGTRTVTCGPASTCGR